MVWPIAVSFVVNTLAAIILYRVTAILYVTGNSTPISRYLTNDKFVVRWSFCSSNKAHSPVIVELRSLQYRLHERGKFVVLLYDMDILFKLRCCYRMELGHTPNQTTIWPTIEYSNIGIGRGCHSNHSIMITRNLASGGVRKTIQE